MTRIDWIEEAARVDALADALLAGDETAAARAVAGLDDRQRTRVEGRARLIVLWHRFAGED
ncbi:MULTISPECIES: hypothetical protein [Methylobacterium]|uniref:Protein of unassigned function n=2 Tax=Methylobacterium TaxID=407 RepID=A0A089NTE1_9HYPH|nr:MULTISPECIES: hypothetical protein [Methylobacterium]ACB24506.1 hypothetical protein Mrad2831_2512 [Methylobacterium radiotolerans JCM 2831]AIQ90677.1 protein of unassigned function [Methylobacterium oryzae CBMB20]